jgi:glutathione S-transferase
MNSVHILCDHSCLCSAGEAWDEAAMPRHLALYYSPGACSLAAHAALREWGVAFEPRRVTLAQGEHLQPEYLALNPRARVPLLIIDDQSVRENSGILTWIGQQSGLYPKAGSYEAAKCGEWLGWLTSGVHISFALIWRGERFAHDKALHPAIRQRGYDWVGEQFAEIDDTLASTPYALGDAYSIVDCNLLPFYRWGGRIGLDMRAYPAWSAWAQRVLERPAVRDALAAEEISLYDALPLPEGVTPPKRSG